MGRWPCLFLAAAMAARSLAQPLDECSGNGACGGQRCDDPDHAVLNDWRCHCMTPYYGDALRAQATCRLDECTLDAPWAACGAATPPQACEDLDHSLGTGGNSWQCVCQNGATGVPARPATCMLNECTAACVTCAQGACGAEQDCAEDSQLAVDTRDWRCECRAPQHGTALLTAATCKLDECSATCTTCDTTGVCTLGGAGQVCQDANDLPTQTNDWVCACVAPKTGQAQRAQASCVLDECSATCGTCAGTTCTGASQDCDDGTMDPTELGNWYCVCSGILTGRAMMAAVQACELDECTAVGCPTCAGTTCSDAGQGCEDKDKAPASTNTWWCQCQAPETGADVSGTRAACEINECTGLCTHCANSVCSNANQDCDDPSFAVPSNWQCVCRAPATGPNVPMNTAVCELNECTEVCGTCARSTCPAPEQECHDIDTDARILDNWVCRCTGNYTGTADGVAATCQLNECDVYGTQCTAFDQDCVDNDPFMDGTWVCHCKSPSTGQMMGATATCALNECESICATCERNACSLAGQQCDDPVPEHLSTSDWTCTCLSPMTGNATAMAAECQLDECTAVCPSCQRTKNDPVGACDGHNQKCNDPDHHQFVKGDWTCTCTETFTHGVKVADTALCILDECVQNCTHCVMTTCADATSGVQTCDDPNTLASSPMDWQCVCGAPATQRETGAAAVCLVDECTAVCPTCAGATCSDALQACNDTDLDVNATNTWMCLCVAPKEGSEMNGAAHCDLDECEAVCLTCEDGKCDTKSQVCDDPVKKEDSLSDWTCECTGKAVGKQKADVADCVLNECLLTSCPFCPGTTCQDVSQGCEDQYPFEFSVNDWECVCVFPLSGRQEMAPATCVTATPEPATLSPSGANGTTNGTQNGSGQGTATASVTSTGTAAPLVPGTPTPFTAREPAQNLTRVPPSSPGPGATSAPASTGGPVTDSPLDGPASPAPEGNLSSAAAHEGDQGFLSEHAGWLFVLLLLVCLSCAGVVFGVAKKKRWRAFEHEDRPGEALRGYNHNLDDPAEADPAPLLPISESAPPELQASGTGDLARAMAGYLDDDHSNVAYQSGEIFDEPASAQGDTPPEDTAYDMSSVTNTLDCSAVPGQGSSSWINASPSAPSPLHRKIPVVPRGAGTGLRRGLASSYASARPARGLPANLARPPSQI
eukprot:TRINITY_DN433_c0_g6_i1.p1 TRINITY_DN433_c0_g6~~TRINITY_DN433_c0_g6_i1.p1  ORF type:complete len:1187 (+),score=325.34 TRINITY_DN433_c0_g6_i1:56-3562(+)